jgi:hypothetical protein
MYVSPVTKQAYDFHDSFKDKMGEDLKNILDKLGDDERQSFMFAFGQAVTAEYCGYDISRGIRERKALREAKKAAEGENIDINL